MTAAVPVLVPMTRCASQTAAPNRDPHTPPLSNHLYQPVRLWPYCTFCLLHHALAQLFCDS